MLTNYNSKNQSWIDLNCPTKEEIDSLVLTQDINPIIAKDFLIPTPKQHSTDFENGIYAVIHIPNLKNSSLDNSEQEIDFLITKDSMITARYASIDSLHHFSKEMEVSGILNKDEDSHIFFGLMREIYKFLFDEIEYIKDWMRQIEKNIFEGKEKEMVLAISKASRNLLSFQRTIGPHEKIIKDMIIKGESLIGTRFKKDSENLLNDWKQLIFEIENIKDVLDELRETNNSMLSTKQNEIMKIFTILAFVTFPLSLIASIFGMNTSFIPLVGLPNDFWVVIGIMIFMSIGMFIYFKYKKWI